MRPTGNLEAQTTKVFIELSILCLLIIVLVWQTTLQIWKFRIIAERSAVESMIGSLKTAISIEISRRILQEGISSLQQMGGANPMDYLESHPSNYLGELNNPRPEDIAGYHWYFDRTTQQLIYQVNNGEYLLTSTKPAQIRFTLKFNYTDRNNNGAFDINTDTLQSLSLESIEPIHWLFDNIEEN